MFAFCKNVITILKASEKVKFAYVYNIMKAYSCNLHIDYEHAQTLFSRVPAKLTVGHRILISIFQVG
jgi:hypothetical protein